MSLENIGAQNTYSRSSNDIFLFNLFPYIDEKKKIGFLAGRGHCLCGVCTFSPRLCGFSPVTLVSSHISKLCTLGELPCLHGASVS